MKPVLLIPAYQPGNSLLEQLASLSESAAFTAIVLVNDGSAAEFDPLFERAAQMPGVHVLRHAANRGKGAALKTGMAFAVRQFPGSAGIITADADGQHLVGDILRVTERLNQSPDRLILGTRGFEGKVPWKSRLGNSLMSMAIRFLTGQPIADTQTGLRGIPASLLATVMALQSSGYEFELEVLLTAWLSKYRIEQIPIQTVYEPGNQSSHFDPVRDSVRIALALLRSCWLASVKRIQLVVLFALLLPAAITAYGFATSHLFSQQIWLEQGLVRAAVFAAVFILLAVPILIGAPSYFRPAVILLISAGTLLAVGPLAPLAALLFLFSAIVIGRAIFLLSANEECEVPLAFVLGAAVLISVEEVLVRLPWNYPWVYAMLMLVPLALFPRIALNTVKTGATLVRPFPLTRIADRAAAAVLTFILAAHWLIVLKPEAGDDALAMHLAIADGVAWKHRFAFDLAHNIWAVMPMGGDWCFTLAYVLGGEFAARLLNYSFLLAIVALLYFACRSFIGRAEALGIATLFAATPLVQLVTGSLFIENVLAAVLLAGMVALWRYQETAKRPYAYGAALLFGTALHIKLGSLASVVPGLLLLAFEIWRKPPGRQIRRLLLSITCGIIVIGSAAPPYVIAAVKTGNPIFPFMNKRFDSWLLPQGADFREPRFHESLSAKTPYDLTFHTSRYYEGEDGSLGFQYLLLLPAGILLLRRSNYRAWSATLVALCGCFAILVSQPNLRYLYPDLPLLHVAIACLLAHLAAQPLLRRAVTLAGFVAALGLDICFLPSSNWYHKGFFSSPLFTSEGRELYLKETEPRRLLIDDLNRKHPGEGVLLPEDSPIAGIRSPVFRNHWHDQSTKTQLDAAHDFDEVLELMRRWKVQWFILPVRTAGIGAKAVRAFALTCVEPDLVAGKYLYGHLNGACRAVLAKQRGLVSKDGSLYDDTFSGVEFVGEWARGERFLLANNETVSYSNVPGAKIRFAFEGTAVTYVYTAAANRGIADVFIDRARKSALDLYSPVSAWQSLVVFDKLNPGEHLLEIEVTGQKNPASTGAYVDLDAFVVRQ